jgi:hypothetical protein
MRKLELKVSTKRGEVYAWLSPQAGHTRTDRGTLAPHSAQYLIEPLPFAMPTDSLSIDMALRKYILLFKLILKSHTGAKVLYQNSR